MIYVYSRLRSVLRLEHAVSHHACAEYHPILDGNIRNGCSSYYSNVMRKMCLHFRPGVVSHYDSISIVHILQYRYIPYARCQAAMRVCVRELYIKPFFLPNGIQHTHCPRWCFVSARHKLCRHKLRDRGYTKHIAHQEICQRRGARETKCRHTTARFRDPDRGGTKTK